MHQLFTSPGDHQFVVPTGVTEMWATLVGAGASGGAGHATGSGGTAGGPGLSIVRWRIYVTPESTLNIRVGAGGASPTIGNNGFKGGASYLTGALLPIPRAFGGNIGIAGRADGAASGTAKGPCTDPPFDDGPQLAAGPSQEYKAGGFFTESQQANGAFSVQGGNFISGSGGGLGADPINKKAGRGRTFISATNINGGAPGGVGGAGGGCTPFGDGGTGGNEGQPGNAPPAGHFGGGGSGGGRGAAGGPGAGGLVALEW